jgi:membrane-associated phospholipid phosphatase
LVVASARALPGLASRTALVLGSIVVVAVVGLSRLYLHAHYWSDVAGGWGLGFGVFGACAVVGLIVAYIRQNEIPSRRGGEPPAAREPPVPAANRR